MTSEQKSYLISQLSLLLDQMVDIPEEQKAVKDSPREMLTVHECTELIRPFHSCSDCPRQNSVFQGR